MKPLALMLLLSLPAVAADGPPKHPASEGTGSWAWPLELSLPASLLQRPPGPPYRNPPKFAPGELPIQVWWPPKAQRIRAVLLVPQNTDSNSFAAHRAVRKVATKHAVGIVYLRYSPHNDIPADTNSIPAFLRYIAQKSEIPEFAHAPWIVFGKSSMGRFPINLCWQWPERTIAGITWHGEVPPFPPPDWARLRNETIPWININGEIEWGGTWYRHVRPCLLNYRAQRGWLAHPVIGRGVNHGNYDDDGFRDEIWEYTALWLDKILALRLPAEGYPTGGPLQLRDVDETSGYCLDARAPEELLGLPYKPLEMGENGYKLDPYNSRSPAPGEPTPTPPRGIPASQLVRAAKDIPAAERKHMFWVPDQEAAAAWLKLHGPRPQNTDAP